MYLFELLKEIRVKDVVGYMRDSQGMTDDMSAEDQEDLYEYFVDKLLKIDPVLHADRVLLGRFSRDSFADEESVANVLTVSEYHIDELENAKDWALILSKFDENNPPMERYAEFFKFDSEWSKVYPSGYAYEFTEWKDVLGFQVDLYNLADCGINGFVADVLGEMSFNGIMEESQQERREELEKSVEEFEQIRQLPKEEQEKYFIPAEKVFRELGFKDTRTKEEKEAEQRRLERDIFYNAIVLAKTLRKYADW